jgi:hypothetical protein
MISKSARFHRLSAHEVAIVLLVHGIAEEILKGFSSEFGKLVPEPQLVYVARQIIMAGF